MDVFMDERDEISARGPYKFNIKRILRLHGKNFNQPGLKFSSGFMTPGMRFSALSTGMKYPM
jgi:hypothetical protein